MNMLLFASLIALFIGPLFFKLTRNQPNLLDLVDGFIFVVIGGLVVFHVLPEAIAEIGLISLLFTLLGLLGPSLAEKLFHRAAQMTHSITLLLGVSGLVLHSMTDGLVLVDNPNESQLSLIIAIVLHRLPVGLTVWWLLRPHFGRGTALAVLAMMSLGTIAGAEFGNHWLPDVASHTGLLLQSFIAGSVLHVVFHRPYAEHQHGHPTTTTNHFDGLGSLIGVFTLLAILLTGEAFHGHHHEDSASHEQLELFIQLALILSPFLLLAYALSSLTSFFFPGSHPKQLNPEGNSGLQTIRGGLLGLPLPFCIPDATKAYQLLRQQGASGGMAMAFLLAAPIMGFESLLVSLPLLGAPMTGIRLVAAILVIILLAWLLSRWIPAGEPSTAQEQPKIAHRLQHALHHGYQHLLDHTAPWLIVGLILAVLLTFGSHQPQPIDLLWITLLALPLRLCATGLTPLAAAMLASGWSPGSVLILMLVGPTISLELIRFIIKQHGKTVALAFGLLLPGCAFSLGWLLDHSQFSLQLSLPELAIMETSALHAGSLGIIVILISWSLLRRGARAFVAELLPKFKLFSHSH